MPSVSNKTVPRPETQTQKQVPTERTLLLYDSQLVRVYALHSYGYATRCGHQSSTQAPTTYRGPTSPLASWFPIMKFRLACFVPLAKGSAGAFPLMHFHILPGATHSFACGICQRVVATGIRTETNITYCSSNLRGARYHLLFVGKKINNWVEIVLSRSTCVGVQACSGIKTSGSSNKIRENEMAESMVDYTI